MSRAVRGDFSNRLCFSGLDLPGSGTSCRWVCQFLVDLKDLKKHVSAFLKASRQ